MQISWVARMLLSCMGVVRKELAGAGGRVCSTVYCKCVGVTSAMPGRCFAGGGCVAGRAAAAKQGRGRL